MSLWINVYVIQYFHHLAYESDILCPIEYYVTVLDQQFLLHPRVKGRLIFLDDLKMKNRILNSPAKMSMDFLGAKRVMLQIRAFLRTFLVDIMLCGRYLIKFCPGRYPMQPHWPLCIKINICWVDLTGITGVVLGWKSHHYSIPFTAGSTLS